MVAGNDALMVNIKKMQRGRVQVVVDDEYVMRYALKIDPSIASDLRKAGCDASDPVYVAFAPQSAKSAEWAKLFSPALSKLRQSGQLAAILARYGLTDWEAP